MTMHYSEETIMRLLGGLKWRKKENIRNEGGAQKKESQKTKQNLVFEPVSRFNFFIVHEKDTFGSFFLSKEIEPD